MDLASLYNVRIQLNLMHPSYPARQICGKNYGDDGDDGDGK
jgi:hypothetical protein